MKWGYINYLHRRKEDVSQSFQHDLVFINYPIPQSMVCSITSYCELKVVNKLFKKY